LRLSGPNRHSPDVDDRRDADLGPDRSERPNQVVAEVTVRAASDPEDVGASLARLASQRHQRISWLGRAVPTITASFRRSGPRDLEVGAARQHSRLASLNERVVASTARPRDGLDRLAQSRRLTTAQDRDKLPLGTVKT